MISLADARTLSFEQVQLLADCFEPVLTLQIPTNAQALICKGLLRSFEAICEHSQRPCFLLSATEEGRKFVDRWIGLHEVDTDSLWQSPCITNRPD